MTPLNTKLASALASLREEFTRLRGDAEKLLWWEAFLRSSFHGFYSRVLDIIWSVGHEDFDWRVFRYDAYLATASSRELAAYKRGAATVALYLRSSLCDTLGMDIEDLLEAANGRDEIEERLRSVLDREDSIRAAGNPGSEGHS